MLCASTHHILARIHVLYEVNEKEKCNSSWVSRAASPSNHPFLYILYMCIISVYTWFRVPDIAILWAAPPKRKRFWFAPFYYICARRGQFMLKSLLHTWPPRRQTSPAGLWWGGLGCCLWWCGGGCCRARHFSSWLPLASRTYSYTLWAQIYLAIVLFSGAIRDANEALPIAVRRRAYREKKAIVCKHCENEACKFSIRVYMFFPRYMRHHACCECALYSSQFIGNSIFLCRRDWIESGYIGRVLSPIVLKSIFSN